MVVGEVGTHAEEPDSPPPSNVAGDPASPVPIEDPVPAVMAAAQGIGLSPPGLISVAPSGMPPACVPGMGDIMPSGCDPGLEGIVPSGDVAPMPGVGDIWAKLGAQLIIEMSAAVARTYRIADSFRWRREEPGVYNNKRRDQGAVVAAHRRSNDESVLCCSRVGRLFKNPSGAV